MLRTALLYADEVQLLSPIADLLQETQTFEGLSGHQMVSKIGRMSFDDAVRWGMDVSTTEEWEGLSRFLRDPSALEPWITELEQQVTELDAASQISARHGLDQMRQAVAPDRLHQTGLKAQQQLRQQAQATHYSELAPFLRTNRIRPIPVDPAHDGPGMLQQLSRLLGEAATDTRRYLLTDELTAGHIHSLLSNGALKIPDRAASNAREARVHHGLVEAMPTLPTVPLEVIWEVREDLRDPLMRYRSDLAEMTTTIGTSAYDPAIIGDIEHLWITTVHPALLDIRSALGSSSRLKSFAAKAGTFASAEGSLGLIAHTWFSWIPDPAALITGVAAPLLTALVDDFRSQTKARQEVQRLPFYFLFEADRRVAKPSIAWA